MLQSHLSCKKAPGDDSIGQGAVGPVGGELAGRINLDGQLGPIWNQQHDVYREAAIV